MDEIRLNEILEESLGEIFQNVRPIIEESIQNTDRFRDIIDISSNNDILDMLREIHLIPQVNTIQPDSENPHQNTFEENQNHLHTETTNTFTSTVPTTIHNPPITRSTSTTPEIFRQPQDNLITELQYLDTFESFSNNIFLYTREYQEQMRLYQQNISQTFRVIQILARIVQTLRPDRNLVSNTRQSTHMPLSNNARTFYSHNPYNLLVPQNVRNLLQQNNIELDVEGFTMPFNNLTNAQGYPTINQILSATERFVYNNESRCRITNDTCPISLEAFQEEEELCEIKHCHHVFKWSSIQTWFSRNSHCPVCRFDIRNHT
uniref:RING-type domain-containing protein n=1 Tax=viral metagenome TaxID=1070528 RepID=A0A6C0CNL9_9ZZZZ